MGKELTNMLITICGGVVVYILCELYTEFVLRPIQEYKLLKAKVAKYLVLYACFFKNPQNAENPHEFSEWKIASNNMREVAAEVRAFSETKPIWLLTLNAIPTKKKLIEASKYLIGISNSFFFVNAETHTHIKDVIDFEIQIQKLMHISQ